MGESESEQVFEELPEKEADETPLPPIVSEEDRNAPKNLKGESLAAAAPVAAETSAHPNSVTFKSDDNISGKRRLTIDAIWKGNSTARKTPSGWGLEISFYQHNNNLSSKIYRPACPADTDDRYWADARMTGATAIYMYNDGVKFDRKSPIQPYLDKNHWSDPCSTGALGFGIGHPERIPYWGLDVPNLRWHQGLSAVISLKKGRNSWSHISAASKFVKNNCAGKPAHTDCMGTGGIWPAKSMGGDSDMLLLKKSRNWRTPTFFAWDAEAVKRPGALKR